MSTTLRHHSDFNRLWAGDTVAQFGTNIGRIVLPLLAVGVLDASAWEMGLLTAAESAAFLLIGLPAGAWVDRMRRRPLMVRMDLARAVLLATVPLAWWLGALTFTQLVLVGLAVGVCTVFFDVGYQSYLPSLVGRVHLVEGNSKLQASHSVAYTAGPAAGGLLVQLMGAASALLTTAGGYLVSAFYLSRIRAVEPEPEREPDRRLREEVAEGLRFVLGNTYLRAIVATTSTVNLFSSVGAAVVVLFLTREVGLSEGVVGLALGLGGVGGIAGAAVAGRVGAALGQGRTIWVVTLAAAPFGLLLPLAAPGPMLVLAVLGMAATSAGVVLYNVAQVSFRQTLCPDRLLGRMNASIRFIVWGTMPLGGLLGGALGTWLGVVPTLWIAAAGPFLGSAVLLASPLRKIRDLPTGAITGDAPEDGSPEDGAPAGDIPAGSTRSGGEAAAREEG